MTVAATRNAAPARTQTARPIRLTVPGSKEIPNADACDSTRAVCAELRLKAVDSVARVGAIVTGSLAGLCGLVNLSWWFDTRFAAYSSYAVLFTAFLTGLLAFFVAFGMLLSRVWETRRRFDPTRDLRVAIAVARVWRKPSRLLVLVLLGVLLVPAIVGGMRGSTAAGVWETSPPFSWHHCHWPLYTNHGTVHACVSHERWVTVEQGINRIFVAGGIILLTADFVLFTTLAYGPRPAPKPARWVPYVAG